MKFKASLVLLSALTGLSACVGSPEPPPARSIEYGTYSCDGSRQFIANFVNQDTEVALVDDGRTYMLVRDESGTYRSNTFTLSGNRQGPITVTRDGTPIYTNCAPLTTQEQYYRKKTNFRPFDPRRDWK